MADVESFIARWTLNRGGAERSNYQLFLSELCQALGVPVPDPAGPDSAQNDYVFERAVVRKLADGETTNFIDLYRRGCFVLEAKQGVEKEERDQAAAFLGAAPRKKGHGVRGTPSFDTAILKAKEQAERYARLLPAAEGRPPFVLVVDVGATIEVFSEFSRSGGQYTPFPDPRTHRIALADLRDPDIQDRLRLIWTDPMALDPARKAAEATREIANALALLARELEADGHVAGDVAQFLMRCLFTMFAEDVNLLPKNSFLDMIDSLKSPKNFKPMAEALWSIMNTGGFFAPLQETILRFNGGLFADPKAIALNARQLELLKGAAAANWKGVEPAIFGTLLERALDPRERHKLGAHYTPRAYVERLVVPTVIEPLRAEWDNVKAAAIRLDADGDHGKAVHEVEQFLQRLCNVRVLDPACGTGNFLYVSLELMKRLEGEVLDFLGRLQTGDQRRLETGTLSVDPHQFLGIEVNPRAAAIAELVLWIGYLQWHYRTYGEVAPPEPVIKNFKNIENRDAILAWDRIEPVLDAKGKPVTRWDGRSMKKSPVTGEDIPDETKRVAVERYVNPRKAEWPEADFVVGNPPFIGDKRMREALGSGYVDALRTTYSELPRGCDLVMYWWQNAALLARSGRIQLFGLIATNSLRQRFNKRITEPHFRASNPIHLLFAIPDHPWVDASDGAAVRISMSVCSTKWKLGRLCEVTSESKSDDVEIEVSLKEMFGSLNPDLTIGVNVFDADELRSNAGLACPGIQLSGQGFVVSPEARSGFSQKTRKNLIRPYLIGSDIMATPRGNFVIDATSLHEDVLRRDFPDAYQWLLERVKPERDQNPRESYRRKWWVFAEPRLKFMPAITGMPRFTATCRTAKHRVFVFVEGEVLPDAKVVAIGLKDGLSIGVLSSRVHVCFAERIGARLGVGNDPTYNHADCFNKFPFPTPAAPLRKRIRELGEALDAHRKRQQALHPKLTMTGMYNVLEKLRSGEALTEKERAIHEQGLVSVLKQIHDDLDAAVFEAYGWSDLHARLAAGEDAEAVNEELLSRLVALNRERAEEEKRGIIRWLRPEFQARGEQPAAEQGDFDEAIEESTAPKKGAKKPTAAERGLWPASLVTQTQAVRAALAEVRATMTAEEIAARFKGARKARVEEILETLASLGQAVRSRKGYRAA